MLVSSLAACGNGNNNGNTASPESSSPSAIASESASPSESPTPSAEPAELTFLANVTQNLTAEFYTDLIAKFNLKYPNITIKMINAPDGDTTAYAKMLLASGSFPDVMNNVDALPFIKANALLDLQLDDDWKQIKNPEADAYYADGKYYSFKPYIQPALVMYYNKKLFSDAGVTDTPKTWDDLFAASQKLKDKGTTPVLLGGEWTTNYVYGSLVSPYVFGSRGTWYKDRYEGKVHFADDYWVKATENYAKLVSDGFVNKGALSLPAGNLEAEFAKGKSAIYPMGPWTSASEVITKSGLDIGVFLPPSEDGTSVATVDRSGGMLISKTTKYSDAAIAFVKFMALDPEAHKAFAQKDSLISNLVTPIAYDMNSLQKQVFDVVTSASVTVGHFNGSVGGRTAVSGMWDAYGKVAQDVFFKKESIADEMKYLDETWDKNQKKDEEAAAQ